MAYTLPGRMVFALQDAGGVRSSLSVPVLFDPTKTGTQLAAAWNTQGALLDAVTGAKILRGEMVIEPAITFTPGVTKPVAGEQMERGGLVDYPFGSPTLQYGSLIPCIDAGVLTTSGRQINEAATAFVNYIAPFETAPAEWEATSNDRNVFTGAHTRSDVVFRKHRRSRNKVSEETP